MGLSGETPTLRIYIAEHCPSCAEARRLAEEVRKRFAGVRLELIDLDKEEGRNPDDVFAVPTYVLNGRTISLGTPTPDQLFSRLAAALLRRIRIDCAAVWQENGGGRRETKCRASFQSSPGG